MNIDEAVEYICRVQWGDRSVGLKRMEELLEGLGRPDRRLKLIHVAGTNGKGSVCAMLSSVLRHAGYRTGMFTSPHLVRINERIRLDGEDISDEDFCRLTERIRSVSEQMQEEPTEYEKLTAMGFLYYEEKGADIALIEVGLGGELDSTNAIEAPVLSVITAIGLDHCALLGNTLPEIAGAKAGIIKRDCPVVVYGGDDEVVEVFKDKALDLNSPFFVTDFSQMRVLGTDIGQRRVSFEGFEGEYLLPFAAEYQERNAALVFTAVRVLREAGLTITDESLREGFLKSTWAGRFEILGEKPLFILDGAHNPQGIRAAAASLEIILKKRKEREAVFVLGILADKDVEDMIDVIGPYAAFIYTVTPNTPRALDGEVLAERIRSRGRKSLSCNSIAEAVRLAIQKAGPEGIVCTLGSLYISGEVREMFARPN